MNGSSTEEFVGITGKEFEERNILLKKLTNIFCTVNRVKIFWYKLI